MVDISVTVTTPAPDAFTKMGRKIREEMLKTMRSKTQREVKSLFQDTVFGWSKKPYFTAKFSGGASELSVSVTAGGDGADIYALVNAGSPPHPIYPRNGRFLRFKPGYRPSTSPGQLRSRRAYRSGRYVIARSISDPDHPGFKAREFPKTIKEEYAPTFEKDMQDAVRRGSR